jgi:hypothetical protein
LSCGLRQPADNAEVGGKLNSQHLYLGGNSAADIEQLPVTLPEAFDWIRLESGLPFDQLILEYENSGDGCRPGCLHISYNSELATQRREALTGSTGNGLIYTQVASWPGAARSMNG